MWWVVITFGAIAVLAGLAGVWKLRAELVHVAHENELLVMQNANLRGLVDKLRARARDDGATGAARLLADVRGDRDALVDQLNAYEGEVCQLRELVRLAIPMVHAYANNRGEDAKSWQRIHWMRRVPFYLFGSERNDATTPDADDARAGNSDGAR